MDMPKLPQYSPYVFERSIITRAGETGYFDDLDTQRATDAENWGGHFIFTSGTAASGTSLSTVQTHQITFIPSDGVIPSHFFEHYQNAHNMEQIINSKKK